MIAKRGRASYTGERSIGIARCGRGRHRRHRRIAVSAAGGNSPRSKGAAMKKFVNDPKQFVPEMLKGIALANPDALRYVPQYNLIMRADAPSDDKVSIIQGSGSGHEPAHVMVVGRGMLDAACPGDVFSAPPVDLRLRDHQAAERSKKGVLLSGQQLHRRPAGLRHGREMAEADGHPGATPLIVDDDVAVDGSTHTVGRRGVAGNFFVIKAVGAAAE